MVDVRGMLQNIWLLTGKNFQYKSEEKVLTGLADSSGHRKVMERE